MNFWKLFGKKRKRQIAEFYLLLEFSDNFVKTSRECSKDFSQAINSLISGWTAYTKNINPSVLRIDLPLVGLYVQPIIKEI